MKYKIIQHGKVFESDAEIFGYAAWPTVTKMSDGCLAAVFSYHRLQHVDPFGKTAICYSYDEGKTWTEPLPVIDTPLDDRDGGIVTDGMRVMITSFNNSPASQRNYFQHYGNEKLKKLAAAYLDCIDENKTAKYLGSTYRTSTDGGKTFGHLRILPITCPHGPCLLKDGRIFYAGNNFSAKELGENVMFGQYRALPYGIYYMTSDDWGETWEKPVPIKLSEEDLKNGYMFYEPHAAKLDDGKVLIHFRVEKTGFFGIYQSVYDPEKNLISVPEKVIDAGSPPHLKVLRNGNVVCTYGYRALPYGQRARVSTDNGKTWGDEIILRDDAGSWDCGYPSTEELSDGSLITVYYQSDKGNSRQAIYYTKWKIAD